jgi:hypothetical protein
MSWWTRSPPLRKCALFVAIPLNRAAFAAAAARGEPSGFTASAGGWHRYESLANLGLATVEDARRFGVSVTTDATLESWIHALGRFEVVTLVAHWRSSRFQKDDVRRWDALLDAALDPASMLRQVIERLDESRREPEGYDVLSLVRWLDGLPARAAEGDAARSVDARLVDEEYRRYRRRQAIEPAVPGVLGGGPAVEFADGFRMVPEILDRIDPAIAGVVDLTVCNSVLLGEEIRRKCPDCIVMVNAQPASPAFRLSLYRQVIELMRVGGRSYPDTMMRLRQHLRDTAGVGGG